MVRHAGGLNGALPGGFDQLSKSVQRKEPITGEQLDGFSAGISEPSQVQCSSEASTGRVSSGEGKPKRFFKAEGLF